MKFGKAHSKTAMWLNFHWKRVWISFTFTIKEIKFGISWNRSIFAIGKIHTDIRIYFPFFNIVLEFFSKNYWEIPYATFEEIVQIRKKAKV